MKKKLVSYLGTCNTIKIVKVRKRKIQRLITKRNLTTIYSKSVIFFSHDYFKLKSFALVTFTLLIVDMITNTYFKGIYFIIQNICASVNVVIGGWGV